MRVDDLPTPALVIDATALEHNLSTMAAALPGSRLRPHVKAHKCTALARRQAAAGHRTFTTATVREALGLAASGLGDDVLVANEVLDAARLRELARCDARVTLAVDSRETVAAAAAAGILEVLVDVNVGLPRCGCAPEQAGAIADDARRAGLMVRGVMGYEGHVVGVPDGQERRAGVEASMVALSRAHADVGGAVISAGGTGTYDLNHLATEIQAGSYVLMDTAYAKLGLPFHQAVFVVSTVISRCAGYAVCDAGLKALGMDHGNPELTDGRVLFCSDEHTTFVPASPTRPGARVRLIPAHVDPTVAYHAEAHVLHGNDVVETWPIDLRGW